MIPLGKSFAMLTKYYIGVLSEKLAGVDIDRYFYVVSTLGEKENAMCQKDLADAVSIDSVSMVRVVDYLAKKGFIKRVRDKKDRRYHQLVLTAKAHEALPLISKAYQETEEQCFRGFSKEERELFHRLILKMQVNLQDQPRRELKIKLNYKNNRT